MIVYATINRCVNNKIALPASPRLSTGDSRSDEAFPNLSPGHPQRWNILWILCGSLVLVVVSVSSLNVAIPAVQRGLGATATELQWIIDSYAVVFAGALLPAGALGDRFGRRGALMWGLAVFGIAAAAGMLADTPTQLIASRSAMGLGAALIMPATLSIVATVFGPEERGKAIAIWAGFAGAGGVVGLLSSGVLLERFWWGSVFAVNIPIVVLLSAAVLWLVPTSKDPDATPFDPAGAVLSMLGLGGLVFGVIEGAEKGWTSPESFGGFGLGLLALTAFVVWELRSDHPLLDPRFFANRDFSVGCFTITVAFFGIFGMFFVTTQFLQFVQGYDPLATGLRILPYALVLLVVAPLAARAADRHGARIVIASGAFVGAAGFAWLALLEVGSSSWTLAGGLATVAIGTGLLMPPATTALVASLPPAKAGVGSAMNDTTREVGGALGIAVVGALLKVGYSDSLGTATDALDAEARHIADDSIGGLLAVAAQLPPAQAEPLVAAGRVAFVDGQALGLGVAAALLFTTAVVVLAALPGGHR